MWQANILGCACGRQRTNLGESVLSLLHVDPKDDGSPGLVTSYFVHRAILPAQDWNICQHFSLYYSLLNMRGDVTYLHTHATHMLA